MPGPRHWLVGRDISRWRRGLVAYDSVVYREVAPGVDATITMGGSSWHLRVEGRTQGAASEIMMRVEGVAPDRIAEQGGGVVIETSAGPLWLGRPPSSVGADTAGSGESTVRLAGEGRIAIRLAPQDSDGSSSPIVSTFLGGTFGDKAKAVAIDDDGHVVVAGFTNSLDFPVTPGAYDLTPGNLTDFTSDGFVARLDPALSQIEFATYLGGNSWDRLFRMVLADDGRIIVAGQTDSSDYPVTPAAFDNTVSNLDGFVSILSQDGSDLLASTILGGDSINPMQITDIDVDEAGAVAVFGLTAREDHPTVSGAYQEQKPNQDPNTFSGFVSILDGGLSALEVSTYLGGPLNDSIYGGRLTPSGSIVVAGRASGPGFPTTSGAFAPVFSGSPTDAFVSQLSADATTLEYSTFLGGSKRDYGWKVDLGPDGSIVLVGETSSSDFPTTVGAIDSFGGTAGDIFISRLDATLSDLLYSTFLGGGLKEAGPMGVAVGPSGEIAVAAATTSSDFPVTPGAFQTQLLSFPDSSGCVALLSPSGRSLIYSTILGGTGDDLGWVADPLGIVFDGLGNVIVASETQSTDFPTTPGTAMEGHPGGTAAFIAKLSMLPFGVARYGLSTPGVGGPISIGVGSQPAVGNTLFSFTCSNAPAGSSPGYLAVSLGALAAPVALAGAQAWIDPQAVVAILPMQADALGWAQASLPIREEAGVAGITVFAQAFWPEGSAGMFASSNALSLVVAP